jgi:hypothetical protein
LLCETAPGIPDTVARNRRQQDVGEDKRMQIIEKGLCIAEPTAILWKHQHCVQRATPGRDAQRKSIKPRCGLGGFQMRCEHFSGVVTTSHNVWSRHRPPWGDSAGHTIKSCSGHPSFRIHRTTVHHPAKTSVALLTSWRNSCGGSDICILGVRKGACLSSIPTVQVICLSHPRG